MERRNKLLLPGEKRKMSNSTAPSVGVSMGCSLAMILSYSINHSIGWAILHGICSWGYVLYYVISK